MDEVELDDQTGDLVSMRRTRSPFLESSSRGVEGFKRGACLLATQMKSFDGIFLNQLPM